MMDKLCSSLRINHAKEYLIMWKSHHSVFKAPCVAALCLFLSDNLDILDICQLTYFVQLARHKLQLCNQIVTSLILLDYKYLHSYSFISIHCCCRRTDGTLVYITKAIFDKTMLTAKVRQEVKGLRLVYISTFIRNQRTTSPFIA